MTMYWRRSEGQSMTIYREIIINIHSKGTEQSEKQIGGQVHVINAVPKANSKNQTLIRKIKT